MRELQLTGSDKWKALMNTVYMLLHINDLLQKDFSATLAKEELKLISKELIKSHLEIF